MTKNIKKISIWSSAVISLLIFLPFFIPTQSYLNKVEGMASEKLGVPVTIASGHWLLLPSPRVVVNDITLGKFQEIKVAQIVVVPSLTTLFSATKVIDLNVSKPIIKQAAVALISTLSSKPSDNSDVATINIRNVKVDALQFDWPDMKLPHVNLDADFTNANVLTSAKLETADGALKADVTPKGGDYLILVQADKLLLPIGLPLVIDKAQIEMQITGNRLEIPNINIDLYKGKLTGNAMVSWDKNWRTSGKLKVHNLSVKEPSRMVSKAVYLSGSLLSHGDFSSSAKEATALIDNMQADFRFSVNNGVLHGLDLVKVASLLVKQDTGNAETEFNEFSGLFSMRGRQHNLRDLKISSGLLTATGQVKIKPNKELDGIAQVELKHSVSLVAIPLEVSGTLSNPVVLPSKAAMAGAIAGTAILGPGVGTSLGIKAGGAVDRLKGFFQSK
ncbi:MAG: AsmA family protein [Methylotenera sp.]|nr:AsmA family protein [Methylotenera sp.]